VLRQGTGEEQTRCELKKRRPTPGDGRKGRGKDGGKKKKKHLRKVCPAIQENTSSPALEGYYQGKSGNMRARNRPPLDEEGFRGWPRGKIFTKTLGRGKKGDQFPLRKLEKVSLLISPAFGGTLPRKTGPKKIESSRRKGGGTINTMAARGRTS